MPTPLPDPSTADLSAPDAAEVVVLGRGLVSAVTPDGGLTATQHLLVTAVVRAMTGHQADLDAPTIDPAPFAQMLARRTLAFRTRIVQIMVLVGLVLRPIPPAVADRIEAFARELSVEEGMVALAQRFASGSLGLAAADFERNGYVTGWSEDDAKAVHVSKELDSAWDTVLDPALAERWRGLEALPSGTLGQRVTELYRARGFAYPGDAGAAPPLLAQHDWVHVLADYGTTVEAELEVFAFLARANDDLRAFSLLAMVVSLFETGYLRTGAGLFESDPGHLSRYGVAVRVADAMRRGALCRGSNDFLRTDWFELAPLTLDEAREHFGVVPKADEAVAAGSVGPWEPGGISPFQLRAGNELAARQGRPYDAFGASLATGAPPD